MKWFKAITVGLMVVNEFITAASDGSISVKEILDIGIRAADKAGYSVEDTKWELFDEQDLTELEDL